MKRITFCTGSTALCDDVAHSRPRGVGMVDERDVIFQRDVADDDRRAQRAKLLHDRVVDVVRQLSDGDLEVVGRMLKRHPHIRGSLTNALRQEPISPVLKQAARKDGAAGTTGWSSRAPSTWNSSASTGPRGGRP